MEFLYIFMISLSLAILGVLFVQAIKRRSFAGAKPFMAQIIFVVIWSISALFELWASGEKEMLLWRNVQQIGIFCVPVTCVYFAAEYGQYTKWKRYLPLFWIVPAAALALIFTDEAHHIMRVSYVVEANRFFGKALMVTSTPAGLAFVAYNFCLVAITLIMLGLFAAKVARKLRRQVILIMVSFFLVFGFAFLKTAWLEKAGINIPIVTIYLPSSILLFYNLFRHRMFMITPIARDKVFDIIEQGIIVTDDTGMIVDRNPYAMYLMKKFFGIDREPLGCTMSGVFSGYPEWVEHMEGNIPGKLEVQAPLKDTGMLYVRINIYPLLSESRQLIGMVSLLRDITARRLQEYELRTRANMDSLTGLLNRCGFMAAFNQSLDDARESGGTVSVLMIDLDMLKPINDTYGHFSGDKVLLSIAEMLRGSLRQQDAIGRIGGDEFAAVLPGTACAGAMQIAERIRMEAQQMCIEMENGQTIHVTISVGVCGNTGHDGGAEELLKLADKAMYEAKRHSRNCCVLGK